MSLHDDKDAGSLAKLDEAEGRGWSLAEMDAMTDRLRTRSKRVDVERLEAERAELEERDLCESEAAEDAKWAGVFRGQAEHWGGEVVWPESGPDRRCFDVSGRRGMAGL